MESGIRVSVTTLASRRWKATFCRRSLHAIVSPCCSRLHIVVHITVIVGLGMYAGCGYWRYRGMEKR